MAIRFIGERPLSELPYSPSPPILPPNLVTRSSDAPSTEIRAGAGTGINNESLALSGRVFHVEDTGTADTDFTITHDMGFTPNYYLVVGGDDAKIRAGSVSADSNTLTLQTSSANADIWVLIIGS